VSTHITLVKFGGTSIQDAPAFERVAQIVKTKASAPLIVVASAMSGVTDALIAGFRGVASSSDRTEFVTHASCSFTRFDRDQSR
jgi:aspartate kinase